MLSTQAHFFGAALETVAENSRYVVDSDNTQHPTATSTSQNVAVVLNIFFLGVYMFFIWGIQCGNDTVSALDTFKESEKQ